MRSTFLIIAILTVLLFSCKSESKHEIISASTETTIDTSSASCPYLTKDSKNNIVLSWIKQIDTSTSIFCYAISEDHGKTFGKTIEVPGSTNVHPHGENMPKVIFKPSGEIIAAWGAANPNPKNAYSGLVYYSHSFNNGKTWTKLQPITKDTASFDQRYFDIALLPDGEAGIVWLDNRKTSSKEGSGLYYAVTNGSTGFQNEKLIAEPCCQCCRTDLFIDTRKNIHVLYRAIINDSIRDMVHIVSTDNGKSFTQPLRISQDNWVINGCPHTGPAMAENKEGLQFTWFTGGSGSGIYYNTSKDNGKTFTARNSVSGKAAKHCQITTLPNDNILIVWNESFLTDNKFSSRIGIEERDAKGSTISKQYITSDSSSSSFPVIYPIDKNRALVAFTESLKNREQVLFKQLILHNN